jgi:DNA-binding response OmpR family regulator
VVAGTVLVATRPLNERAVLQHWALGAGYWSIALDRGPWIPDALPTRNAVLVFDESWCSILDEGCSIAARHGLAAIAVLAPESTWVSDLVASMWYADFVRRPYPPDDAFARIHRALCFAAGHDVSPESGAVMKLGAVTIDTTSREVSVHGRSVRLRRAELKVLLYLVRSAPSSVSRSDIVKDVLDSHGDGAAARNQIWELRRKLAAIGLQGAIESLRGRGAYRMRLPPDVSAAVRRRAG